MQSQWGFHCQALGLPSRLLQQQQQQQFFDPKIYKKEKLPLIVKCSIELKRILSIKVAE